MFRLPFLFIATGLVLFGLFNLATILQASGWIRSTTDAVRPVGFTSIG